MIKTAIYSESQDENPVKAFILRNDQGMSATVIEHGATLTSLMVPDSSGRRDNVVLGYPDLAGYRAGSSYIGALIGRVANRIAGGRFRLDGNSVSLVCNENGINHLHGGEQGFDQKHWRGELVSDDQDGEAVRLRFTSKSGDQSYPGEVEVSVKYRLTNANELIIDYCATSDRPTPFAPTQHSYFNLSGRQNTSVAGHWLRVKAENYTPLDANQIPTGDLSSVDGTALDFRMPRALSEALSGDSELIRDAGGIDHNYVVDCPGTGPDSSPVAQLSEPISGRDMLVWSDFPGVQVYTGNFLQEDAAVISRRFIRHGGICLECQEYPNAVNTPSFPSCILRPSEIYQKRVVYQLFW